MITGPLRDRFGLVARLDYYDTAELEAIVRRAAGILGVTIDDDGGVGDRPPLPGHAAHRQPPAAPGARLRRGARRRRRSTPPRHAPAWRVFGVDDLGLDKVDRPILGALCQQFRGGPVGLSTLAIARRRAARDGRGRVRAVPHPARPAGPHATRPGGDAGGLRAPRPDRPRRRPRRRPRPLRLSVLATPSSGLRPSVCRQACPAPNYSGASRTSDGQVVGEVGSVRKAIVLDHAAGGRRLVVEHRPPRGCRRRGRRASTLSTMPGRSPIGAPPRPRRPRTGCRVRRRRSGTAPGRSTSSSCVEHAGHARAVVADAHRRLVGGGDAEGERAAEAEADARPGRPSTSGSSARCSRAATQSATALPGVEVGDLAHRRREPVLVVVGRPARGEAPEHVGRADDVAGVGQPLGHGLGCTARRRRSPGSAAGPGAAPAGGQPRRPCAIGRRRRWSRSSRAVAHAGIVAQAVRSLGRRAPGGLRLRPAARAHRPATDRATRRRPAARRSGRRAARPPPRPRPADAPAARRPARRQRDPGAAGPAAAAARQRRSASRSCCSSATDGDTWEALVRPGGRLRAGEHLARRRRRGRGRAARPARAAGRHVRRPPARPRRLGWLDRPARSRCRRTSRAAGRPRALPDRLRPTARARRRRRPPACTSPPSCCGGIAERGVESPPSSSSSAWTRSSPSPRPTR